MNNILKVSNIFCGSGSVVEHRLAKARVASSNLVFRSIEIVPRQFAGACVFVHFEINFNRLLLSNKAILHQIYRRGINGSEVGKN